MFTTNTAEIFQDIYLVYIELCISQCMDYLYPEK